MDKDKIKEGVRLILEGIGEDINREGLLETPDRIAKMYDELAAGYHDSAAAHLAKRFHVEDSDMIIEKDITFYSFCEHHMLPFMDMRRWHISLTERSWDYQRSPGRWRSSQSDSSAGAAGGTGSRRLYGGTEAKKVSWCLSRQNTCA